MDLPRWIDGTHPYETQELDQERSIGSVFALFHVESSGLNKSSIRESCDGKYSQEAYCFFETTPRFSHGSGTLEVHMAKNTQAGP